MRDQLSQAGGYRVTVTTPGGTIEEEHDFPVIAGYDAARAMDRCAERLRRVWGESAVNVTELPD